MGGGNEPQWRGEEESEHKALQEEEQMNFVKAK